MDIAAIGPALHQTARAMTSQLAIVSRLRPRLPLPTDGGRSPLRANCALRSVSGRERKNRRALGCLDADTSAGSVEKLEWTILDCEVGPKYTPDLYWAICGLYLQGHEQM